MTMELVVDNDVTRDVSERALSWPEQARACCVLDDAAYARAAELLVGIKGLRAEVNLAFDPIIADAHRTHKTACDKKRLAEAPLVEAEGILKTAMGTYHREQERLRVLEERRLQDEARQEEEARRLNAAAALELEGNRTENPELLWEANELIEQPVIAPPVTVASTTPKIAGIVHRDNWSARVTDLKALVKYVAAHPEHLNLLQPNTTALNQLAKAMKTNLKVDGVQAFNAPVVAAGGR